MRKNLWVLWAGSAVLGVLAATYYFSGHQPARQERGLDRPVQALYVWQRVWNDDVRQSLVQAANVAQRIMVLAREDRMPPLNVDWKAVADTGLDTTLVFRYPSALGEEFRSDPIKARERVADEVLAACRDATAQGVRVEGIQLDYDAPTASLMEYARFVHGLAPLLPPELALSITALPTWLADGAFADLVGGLDYYVLQVHSFERPGSIKTPPVLCDTARIPGYVSMAERLGIPYFIAFPTHGYQVAFDAAGAFIGLSAEGPDAAWPPGSQLREVRADPGAIAEAVKTLWADPPDHYLGAVWFRMPVASDTRNWTWPVLSAVMDGRVPRVQFQAEVRHPEPGLAEIWLASVGEDRPRSEVDVELGVSAGAVLASDFVNGFQPLPGARDSAVILRGNAPVGKEPIMIGWYRMGDTTAAATVNVAGITGQGQSISWREVG